MLRFVTFSSLSLFLAFTGIASAEPVSGKVVSATGAPVVGARIIGDDAAGKPLDTKTDAAGTFTVDAAPQPNFETNPYRGRIVVVTPGGSLAGGTLRRDGNVFKVNATGQVKGRVVDAQGNPVAGVKVRLETVRYKPKNNESPELLIVPPQLDIVTTSGADGTWVLKGVPLETFAWVKIQAPGMAEVGGKGMPESTEIKLVATPEARISGRLTDENGQPVAGIEISASAQRNEDRFADSGNNYYARGKTDEQGKFVLGGLSAGIYRLGARLEEDEGGSVVRALFNIRGEAGKENAGNDLKREKGILIQGVVSDTETGVPIPKVQVGLNGPRKGDSLEFSAHTFTDAAGHYQMVVPASKVSLYLSTLPADYPAEGRAQKELSLIAGRNETLNWSVERGQSLQGIALDSKGQPIKGAVITTQSVDDIGNRLLGWDAPQATTGADGKFTIRGLSRELKKVGLIATDNWEAKPLVVDLAATPGGATPVELRLSQTAFWTLRGRALTPEGTPIAGAKVTYHITKPINAETSTGSQQEDVSAPDGSFQLPQLRGNWTVKVQVEKTGFTFERGPGKMTGLNSLGVADFVLSARSRRLTGIVVSAQGQPVSGAFVTSPDAQSVVKTDAGGKWTLDQLPSRPVQVVAWSANQDAPQKLLSASADVNGDNTSLKLEPVEQLKPEGDSKRGYEILKELLQDAKGKTYFFRSTLPYELAALSPELAIQLAGETGEAQGDYMVGGIAAIALATRDQAGADPRSGQDFAEAQLPGLTGRARFRLLAQIIPIWKAQGSPKVEAVWGEVMGQWPAKFSGDTELLLASSLVSIAAQLGKPEAKTWGSALIAELERRQKETPDRRDWTASLALSALAEGDAALALEMASQIAPERRADALSQAAQEAAESNLNGAIALARAALAAPLPERAETMNSKPGWAFGIAVKAILEIALEQHTGKTLDDATATQLLALAREVEATDHRGRALFLAAQLQPKANRLAILEEALKATQEDDYDGIENRARIAAAIRELDAKRGEEVWAQLRERIAAPNQDENARGGVNVICFFMGSACPQEARQILESRFAKALSQSSTSLNGKYDLITYAMAMAPIDFGRALEIAKSLGPEAFDVRRKLAQYALADAETRRNIYFSRWTASDSWRPGTPTHW